MSYRDDFHASAMPSPQDDFYCECEPDSLDERDCFCGGWQSFNDLLTEYYSGKIELAGHPYNDEWIAIQVAAIARIPAASIPLDEITLRRQLCCSDAEIIEALTFP